MIIQDSLDFEDFLNKGIAQIRQNAHQIESVLFKMLDLFCNMIVLVKNSQNKMSISKHADAVYEVGIKNIQSQLDQKKLEEMYQNFKSLLN